MQLSLHNLPHLPLISTLIFISLTMKHLLKSINPKNIFHLKKKSRSVSKSAPSSFGAASSSSSSSSSSNLSVKSEQQIFRFDYIQAFNMIDRDGDGKITVVELESLLRRVIGSSKSSPPLTEQEVVAMIGEIDRDGDGCISLEELRAVDYVFESTVNGEDELREAFDIFDVDNDGKITAEELHAVFVALGDERCSLNDCKRMIHNVDKNCDGFVCFDDFTRMMDLPRS